MATTKKTSKTLGAVGSAKKTTPRGGNGKARGGNGKDTGTTTCSACETEAQTKAPPRKATRPAQIPSGMHGQPASEANQAPTSEQIAERAYLIWELQGRQHGKDTEYWLEAERQLRQESRQPQRRRH
jgi:hypothetical protein